MRPVNPTTPTTSLDTLSRAVNELQSASQDQVTAEIADAYTITGPVPTRTLNVATPTLENIAAVLGTFFIDLQNRGSNRKRGNA